MIRAKIMINDLDYDSLLRYMVPLIESSLAKQSNPLLRMAAKLIGKDGEPTGLASLFMNAIPKKEELTVSLLPHFDEALIKKLNVLMVEQGVSARLHKIASKVIDQGKGAGIEFTLVFDQINYESTADNLLPESLQKLVGGNGKLAGILSGREKLAAAMLKAAIGAVPPKEQDELMVSIMRQYRDEIINLLDKLLKENDIKARISRIGFDCMW